MVILVTGSSGFVGKSLIPQLKKIGYDVIGLDRKPGENTDLIQDISKKFKINKPIEAIIHLAARLEHERCSKKEFFSTNVVFPDFFIPPYFRMTVKSHKNIWGNFLSSKELKSAH